MRQREREYIERQRSDTNKLRERQRTRKVAETEQNYVEKRQKEIQKQSHTYNERDRNMQKKRQQKYLDRLKYPTDTQNRDRFGGDRSGQKTRQLEIDTDNNRMRETY